jgi:hypothetical protein
MVEPRRDRRKAAVAKLCRRQRCRLPPWARRGRRCGCRQFWRGRVAVSWQVRTIRGSSQMGAYASGAPGWARAPGRLARWPAPGLRPLCARTDVAVTSRQSLQRLERRTPVRLTEHAMRPAGPSVKVKSGTMVDDKPAHSRSVLSQPSETIRRPSGLNATLSTAPVWPVSDLALCWRARAEPTVCRCDQRGERESYLGHPTVS